MTNSIPNPGIDFPFTTWEIVNMERTITDGVVYTVHYTVTHFKDGEQAGAYGSIGLEAPDINTMIPYANLDKNTVIDWVKEKLGGEEKIAEIEQALDAQIAEKVAPTKASGVPWVQ